MIARLALGSFVVSFGLVACGAPSDSASGSSALVSPDHASSDLTHDLALKAGPEGAPFAAKDAKPLASALRLAVASIADDCFEQHTTLQGTTDVLEPSILTATKACAARAFGQTANETKWTAEVKLAVNGVTYTAVNWDAPGSDGGDTSDVAFYDGSGKRVAVVLDLHNFDDILVDVASMAGTSVRQVDDTGGASVPRSAPSSGH